MRWIRAFFMSMGMFTAIPLPYRPWDERARPWMLSCFPLVGGVIGGLWAFAGYLLLRWNVPMPLRAGVLTALPYLLTGFLHLDGYMDTCDAILSRRSLEEKRRILKDPHAGAFGVISFLLLVLLTAGLYGSFPEQWNPWCLLFLPIATRSCAAVAVSRLRPLSGSQYGAPYRAQLRTPAWVIPGVIGILNLAFAFALCGMPGLIGVLAAMGGYWLAALYSYRQLQGFSGDLSGYALTIGETCAPAALLIIWEVLHCI